MKNLRTLSFLAGASVALLIGSTSAQAQNANPSTSSSNNTVFNGASGFRKWSIGVNGGVLAPVAVTGGSNDFTKWNVSYGYGAYVKYQIIHALGIKANFTGGQITGNNDNKLGNGQPPNSPYKEFTTKLNWSGALSAEVNVFTINWLHRKNFVQLYASVGGGIAGYKPRLTDLSNNEFDYKANGDAIKEFFIPVGAGLKFKLNDFMNLDLGYTVHYVDGDNLDGYVKGPNKDKFSYGYAGLEFSLGQRIKPQLAWTNSAAVAYDELVAQRDQLRLEVDAAKQETAQLSSQVSKLTTDSDKDGVSDFFDKCPDTPEGTKVDGSGCELPKPPVPEKVEIRVTEEDNRIVREAIQNLEFETGKASIKPYSYPPLDRVAELLVKKGLSLKLSGHTDNTGNANKNLILSRQRAEAVKTYLVSKGANPSKIEAVGYGQTQPIASNKTVAGRQKNRRVEFTLY
ncbi:OOP family OmpA-OmpF porin [Chitinophaga skermanii]|uniref:OOP family OmpA-OmpF porin n=1 Tax=Chitinophaga skermanii TaxID=331697 RepID=A0A327QL74_9BACT|nr:OmpA family protein [Chitinophaga skermanii]RAJ05071.1 OOP family OmpA-OmpF porin [Chitinophaga skermanii]